jgi:hypothetical protein
MNPWDGVAVFNPVEAGSDEDEEVRVVARRVGLKRREVSY